MGAVTMQSAIRFFRCAARPVRGRNSLVKIAIAILLGAAIAVSAFPSPLSARSSWDNPPIRSRYVAPARQSVIIRGATILVGDGSRIDDGDILLRNGKIARVGKDIASSGELEIDGRGLWITPGLIDVHSHDGTFVLPLLDIDSHAGDVTEGSDINVADTWIETAVNPQDVAFSRALRAGVTTLQILPGSTPIFGGHAVVVHPVPAATLAEMKFPGAPVGIKMACGENPKSTGGKADHKDWPTSRQGVFSYMRASFQAAKDYLANERSGRAQPNDPKKAALAGLLAGDFRLHMHCYRASDLAAMLDLADEFDFRITAFHHATEAYKIADRLKAAGTCAAVWSDWWGYKAETLDAVRANAPILEHAGACVMMHSDSPAVGQRLNIEAAKAAAAGRRIGLAFSAEQMIRWTTSVPARALGLEDRIGTLAAGYNADLVVWSGDPFSIYSQPRLVFIDGAIRFDRSDAEPYAATDFELGRIEYGEVK